MEAGAGERLTTDRLVLEPLQLAHADEMVAVLADDRLYEYTGGSAPTLDALVDRYRHQIRGPGRDNEEWFNWIARRIDSGAVVGYVQATVIDERANVAWLVGVDHQRQGFAGEAAKAMLAWLVKHGVRSFSAHVAVDHIASARVAERIGMERTNATDDNGEEVWSTTTADEPPRAN
ncbi:MAG: GNAT family N-acetyltransferase [Actinomycetota bacterium]